MAGVIATKDKCACGRTFPSSKDVKAEIRCACGERPNKYVLNIYWKKKSRLIYRDRLGYSLKSFEHAKETLATIRAEIRGNRFDPELYTRKGSHRFENLFNQLLKNYTPESRTYTSALSRGKHLRRFFSYQVEDIFPYLMLMRHWYKACEDAGYPPIQIKNETRHSLGMRLVKEAPDSKGGIWLAAQILGHSSINMTRHYAEMLTDDMAPALTRKGRVNSFSIPIKKSRKKSF